MKKILTPLILLAILALFLYFQADILNFAINFFDSSTNIEGEAIAELNEKNKNVRLKRANSTIWNSAEKNDKLAKQDSLSTGYDSSALIKFETGYFLRLGENSYIVIDKPQEDIDISMDKGVIQAKNETNDESTLIIKTRSSITEVKGKSEFGVRVNKDNDTSEVWVSKGKAKVINNKGQETIVNRNEQKQFLKDTSPSYIFKDFYFDVQKEVNKEEEKDTEEQTTLSPAQIQLQIARNRKRIDACYLRAKIKYSNARASFSVTVSPNGIVKDVRLVSTSFNDHSVQTCIMSAIKTIKFSRFKGADSSAVVNIEFQ